MENIVEMTLILKWITRRRSAIPAATNRTRMLRKSIRAGSVMTTGANRLGSCTQMDVYGNRLDIIGSSVNIDDLKSTALLP
ncbi:MAG: hypothetical protein ACLSUW_09500 [Akkermansia sp.]